MAKERFKIVGGKVIFGKDTCWSCDGTKKTKVWDIKCPNDNGKVIRKKDGCDVCKANQWSSHDRMGYHEVKCEACRGKGVRQLDLYDHMSSADWKTLLKKIPIEFTFQRRDSNFNEGYLGLGVAFGLTDYGRSFTYTEQQMMDEIMSLGRGQFLSILQQNGKPTVGLLPKKIVVHRVRDGYHGYAVHKKVKK